MNKEKIIKISLTLIIGFLVGFYSNKTEINIYQGEKISLEILTELVEKAENKCAEQEGEFRMKIKEDYSIYPPYDIIEYDFKSISCYRIIRAEESKEYINIEI